MPRTQVFLFEPPFRHCYLGDERLPPGINQASWEVIVANTQRLKRGPFDAILAQYPFETLYCAVERLSKVQLLRIDDATFDRFLRSRPDVALEYVGWRLNRSQVKFCFNNHPNTILYFAPSRLNPSQLHLCAVRTPHIARFRAASLLKPHDLVSVCMHQDAIGPDCALLKNAWRLSPDDFVRLLKTPYTCEALARIVTDENLVDPVTVMRSLLQAGQCLSKPEKTEAESVFKGIVSWM